jgi:hypothetical protein
MRTIMIGLVTTVAALAAHVPSSDAQPRRYCTFGGSDQSSGEPDCSYSTWEQCRASASGLARYCGENPEYLWRARGVTTEPTPKGKPRRER